jgi:hypothetical protein
MYRVDFATVERIALQVGTWIGMHTASMTDQEISLFAAMPQLKAVLEQLQPIGQAFCDEIMFTPRHLYSISLKFPSKQKAKWARKRNRSGVAALCCRTRVARIRTRSGVDRSGGNGARVCEVAVTLHGPRLALIHRPTGSAC